MAPHISECTGDRGVHPRKRLQAENEGVGFLKNQRISIADSLGADTLRS
jgi:hypothetical protein